MESHFSGNTLTDVGTNIDGIRFIYRTALAEKVKARDAALAAEIDGAIKAYQKPVDAIHAGFNTKPASALAEVLEAATKGNALRILLGPITKRHELWRFGLKANSPPLLAQSASVYLSDMGIVSPPLAYPPPEGAKAEIDGETLKGATFYVQSLGVPLRRTRRIPLS